MHIDNKMDSGKSVYKMEWIYREKIDKISLLLQHAISKRKQQPHCCKNPQKVIVNYDETWRVFWNYFQLFFYL